MEGTTSALDCGDICNDQPRSTSRRNLHSRLGGAMVGTAKIDAALEGRLQEIVNLVAYSWL